MKKSSILFALLVLFAAGCTQTPETSTTVPGSTATTVAVIPDYGLEYLQPAALGSVTNYGSAWDGSRLLLASYGGGKSLYALDPATGLVAQLSVMNVSSQWITSMCYADGKLYVQSSKGIYTVDPETGSAELFLTVSCASNFGPSGLASDGTYLYSCDRYDSVIRKYDIATTNLTATFPVRNLFKAIREMTCADGLVWMLDSTERLVYGIDPDDGTVRKTFIAPVMTYLRSMEYCDGVWLFSDNATGKIIPVVVSNAGSAMLSNPQFARVRYVISITNSSASPVLSFKAYAAVPQSGLKQKILGVYYDPAPARFETDAYGQEIAVFEIASIPGNSVCNITVTADAVTRAVRYALPGGGGDLSSTPAAILAAYTNNDPYLTLDDTSLQNEAAAALSEATNTVNLAWSIRNRVLDRMTYVLDSVHKPAAEAWADASGSCSEYSFIFSALARIDGFATRFTGTALFTPSKSVTNSDGTLTYTDVNHHRYVELYFPGEGWIAVDANREDSSSGGPYTSRLFLGYDQNVLEFSKTVFDANYLSENYLSRCTWTSGSPSVSGVAYWTVREFVKE